MVAEMTKLENPRLHHEVLGVLERGSERAKHYTNHDLMYCLCRHFRVAKTKVVELNRLNMAQDHKVAWVVWAFDRGYLQFQDQTKPSFSLTQSGREVVRRMGQPKG